MTAVAYDSSKKLASVNASWLPHGSNTPQYYHVKWGPADLVDMQRRPPPPPPPPVGQHDFRQHQFDQPPEFEPPPPSPADGPEPPRGPPPGSGPNNRGFDLSVWHLRKDFVKNEKVDGVMNSFFDR